MSIDMTSPAFVKLSEMAKREITDLIAENERLTGLLVNAEGNLADEREFRKRAEAKVRRVREYLDSEDTNGHPDRVVKLREVRDALDGEADR